MGLGEVSRQPSMVVHGFIACTQEAGQEDKFEDTLYCTVDSCFRNRKKKKNHPPLKKIKHFLFPSAWPQSTVLY